MVLNDCTHIHTHTHLYISLHIHTQNILKIIYKVSYLVVLPQRVPVRHRYSTISLSMIRRNVKMDILILG